MDINLINIIIHLFIPIMRKVITTNDISTIKEPILLQKITVLSTASHDYPIASKYH